MQPGTDQSFPLSPAPLRRAVCIGAGAPACSAAASSRTDKPAAPRPAPAAGRRPRSPPTSSGRGAAAVGGGRAGAAAAAGALAAAGAAEAAPVRHSGGTGTMMILARSVSNMAEAAAGAAAAAEAALAETTETGMTAAPRNAEIAGQGVRSPLAMQVDDMCSNVLCQCSALCPAASAPHDLFGICLTFRT